MDTTSIIKSLQLFGLSDLEIRIYLTILHQEPHSILDLSRKLGVPRTTIYDQVVKLEHIGLVAKVVEYKNQKIKAYPITILEEKVAEEQKRVSNLSSAMDILKTALAKPISNPAQSEVRYFHGATGIKQMMWNTLSAKTDQVGYSIFGRMSIVGPTFIARYNEEMKRRKIVDRVITNPTQESLEYLRNAFKPGIHYFIADNVRVIDEKHLIVTGDTTIYNNIFAVCYWKKNEVVGIEIENEELVRSQVSIFTTLWSMAKPVSQYIK